MSGGGGIDYGIILKSTAVFWIPGKTLWRKMVMSEIHFRKRILQHEFDIDNLINSNFVRKIQYKSKLFFVEHFWLKTLEL